MDEFHERGGWPMELMEFMALTLSTLLAENLVLVHCMGMGTNERVFLDPVEGRRMGVALTMVMVISGVFSRWIDTFLTNFHLDYLNLLAFCLLIPVVSGVLGGLMKFFLPELSHRLAAPIRASFGNGAVLGAILLADQRGYTSQQAMVFMLFGGIGITVVLTCFAGLREEISLESCPTAFRGLPILLITGGLMALAMVGYYGLNIS